MRDNRGSQFPIAAFCGELPDKKGRWTVDRAQLLRHDILRLRERAALTGRVELLVEAALLQGRLEQWVASRLVARPAPRGLVARKAVA